MTPCPYLGIVRSENVRDFPQTLFYDPLFTYAIFLFSEVE